MKTIIVLVLLSAQVQAQTAAELLQQKKTQRRYLLTQIAAFKLYAKTAAKGYNLVHDGLQTVRAVKSADVLQHQSFMRLFSAGDATNLKKLKETFAHIQTKIQQTKLHMHLKDNQARYASDVFSEILNRCIENIEEIIALSENDKLQIDPVERTRRCDAICEEMEKRKLFTDRFCQSVLSMEK